MGNARPIGIFDSGVGGLSVYRALKAILPDEQFVYLGDTARLPYGTKSKKAVELCTIDAARWLLELDIKFLVMACNTVSAQALNAVQRMFPDLPYCGVIASGAEEAVRESKTGRIALFATEGTLRSGVYSSMIKGLKPDAEVQALACNVLVAMAEEGWFEGPEVEISIKRYLSMLVPGFDTLVLGCTHFPILLPAFRKLLPASVRIIDSAGATARAVSDLLRGRVMLNSLGEGSRDRFFVTDNPVQFERVGARFLKSDLHGMVEHVDLEDRLFEKELENAGDTLNSAA